MRFLHLIRPVMCVLPEVASPDRKVRARPSLGVEDRDQSRGNERSVVASWLPADDADG